MSLPFELTQLERFLAIAHHGSFRAAADALGLTQPTLSWSIRQLEEAVGAPLFERIARGARLTPLGEKLLPRARLIISEGERATHELNVFKQQSDAFLAFGVAPMFVNSIFPVAIAATLARVPGLKVRVTEAYSPELVTALQTGKVDIAFAGEPLAGIGKGIVFEPTYRGQFLVVARAGHPLFRKKITEEAVLSYDFVVFDPVSAGSDASRFAPRNGKNPHVTVRCSSMQSIVTLLKQSDLLGHVSWDYVRDLLAAGEVREVPTKLMGRTVRAGVMTRENDIPSPALRILKAELRKACKA